MGTLELKNTLEPWKLTEKSICNNLLSIGVENETGIIAEVYLTHDDSMKTANLIAACADMYNALKLTQDRLVQLQNATGYPTAWAQIVVNSAIKKAEGLE